MNGSGRIQTGKRGEDIAAAYLKNRGYRIIERNYKCLFGEIDIVAKDGDTVVFVEVKSRKSEKFGDPQGAVGREKQKKISRISLKYLEEKHLYPCDARFDVVAIKIINRLLNEGHVLMAVRNKAHEHRQGTALTSLSV